MGVRSQWKRGRVYQKSGAIPSQSSPLSVFSIKRPVANSCGTRRLAPTPSLRTSLEGARQCTPAADFLACFVSLSFLCVCFVFSFVRQSLTV